jgi:hypothetical protein
MDIAQLTGAADKTFDGQVEELKASWAKFVLSLDVLLPTVTWITRQLNRIVKALTLGSSFSDSVGGFVNNEISGVQNFVQHPLSTTWGNLKSFASQAWAGPATQQAAPTTIIVQSVLDGRVVAESTVNHFISGAGNPSSGNDFDYRSTPYSPGFASAMQ